MSKALVILGIVLASSVASGETLTYADLAGRLTDLERLAVLPEPGETCAQWSSYDRASQFDAGPGRYVHWDANGDGGCVIREEDGMLVLAEMTGPGCIWRIWSARPEKGRVKIFLDGAEAPAVDLPFASYFDGNNPPFNRPALVHTTASGCNAYVPIPYQKSCKVVAEPGWGAYYHFTYSTFPEGTKVLGFTRELDAGAAAALDAADKALSACGMDPAAERPGQRRLTQAMILEPGKSATLAKLEGPRAITGIRIKVDLPPSPADGEALRELAIAIHWDGEAEPSVWAPLGDFFGTAAGANAYRSLPLGLTDDGWWYCYWYMPFAQAADVVLTNDGAEARDITCEVTHAPLTRPIESLGRFHAKWHRDTFPPPEPERAIDWSMLHTTGRGRYCGVMLHVWNRKGGWWGEGDEKFFVDGERFPSTFGTGSEDYFGYAWCNPALFQHAYHNQTISMGNKGHVSVNRWHISDNVPFQTAFDGYIEKYFPNVRPTLFACTAYWYLAPGGSDPYKAATLNERVSYCPWSGPPPTFVAKDVIEAETIRLLKRTAGMSHQQNMSAFEGEWSRDTQMWWVDAKPGDCVDLALPVEAAGRYTIAACFTKARDYGIIRVLLDGRELNGPIDLYNESVQLYGPIDLGTSDLTAGDHVLTIEITGANRKAIRAYMVGIDYLKLTPVE